MQTYKEILTDTIDPIGLWKQQAAGLVKKWEKRGLLEGIKSDLEKSHMAILLENQARELLAESSTTGVGDEQWSGVALPLVRRIFAEISAKEFVSVQPMNLPSGLIFYLDFKYGTTNGVFTKDSPTNYQSLFGGVSGSNNWKVGSTNVPVGGLYGQGRFGYTLNDTQASVAVASSASATVADIYFDTGNSNDPLNTNISASLAAGKLFVLKTSNFGSSVYTTSGSYPNFNAVRSFTISGSGIVTWFPGFTRYEGTEAVFVVSGSSLASMPSTVTVGFSLQPTESTRGDFEDRLGLSSTDTGLNKDVGIPEVNLELRREPIVAHTRKLKAKWTPELAQDLNAYHSIDAEAELTALLSEYISLEVDREILDMLIVAAPDINKERWSAVLNREIVKTGPTTYSVVDTTPGGNGGYYTKPTWYQTLGNKIQKVSNRINQLTLRGGANFIVVGPDVATILESMEGFKVNADSNVNNYAMGVTKVGTFASRYQVYKNPYMQENLILVGFRGKNFFETGAVYAPYIPLIQTPLVYDPVNFTPVRGVMTRYATKVVRPEFYGLVFVMDTDRV